MASLLETVADYVTQARVLLQDTVADYRYPDIDIVNALNMGIIRARQTRADLFLPDDTVPYFTANNSAPVNIDIQYRHGLLLFIVGQIQLRDDEETTDARAGGLMNSHISQLTTAGGGE